MNFDVENCASSRGTLDLIHLPSHFLFVTALRSRSTEEETGTHQEHAEGLAHDAVEEVQTRVPRYHEEVAEKEELPATVVQQGVVLAAEQGLVGVLGGVTRVKGQSDTTSPRAH